MSPAFFQLTTIAAHDLYTQRTGRPATRLDVFRHKSESAKMNHLLYSFDSTHRLKQESLKLDLERRRIMAEHRSENVTSLANVRRAVGQILISAGERIRPQAA